MDSAMSHRNRTTRTTPGPVVVIGDTLLDRDIEGEATRLSPDAPVPVVDVTADNSRPGGAALAACLAARAGREVVLVTALGEGPASQAVRARLAGRVRLVEVPLDGDVPVKTRIMTAGRPLARIDWKGGELHAAAGDELRAALEDAEAVLVADYGRHMADLARPHIAAVTSKVPVVWDPHRRGGPPEPGTRLVTPNSAEAEAAAGELGVAPGDALPLQIRRASTLVERWRAATVAITLGPRGAVLSRGTDSPIFIPSAFEADGDPCGAGDCFAAAATLALADQALPEEAVRQAVTAAGDYVRRGGVADPHLWDGHDERPTPVEDAFQLAEAVRARGGTVVATGGCFDLLHAGHIEILQSARRLGDCLIVCLNSDDSVRRLKGAGRPLNSQEDRARVLRGLECVDAVTVFGESTPIAVLEKLRPHLWVKGGDYTAESLPERETLQLWGGEAIVLPYLAGHSTTELTRKAAATADLSRPEAW
jgi:D-beta-D-heptose 7-phosphate kinase / D-beta-D-heptose 1-phosphate adenosyltransferase